MIIWPSYRRGPTTSPSVGIDVCVKTGSSSWFIYLFFFRYVPDNSQEVDERNRNNENNYSVVFGVYVSHIHHYIKSLLNQRFL